MDNLRNILKKINTKGKIVFNEPMSLHTTFKTGGPADVFCSPADTNELVQILKAAESCETPHFILGGGANILVSDAGFNGIVIETAGLNRIEFKEGLQVACGCGVLIDDAAEAALKEGLSGFDAFYGMPGTIGGAVWMNARCYGLSVSDILLSVKYLDETRKTRILNAAPESFGYKKSPFQNRDYVILEAEFLLSRKDKKIISATMLENRTDRERKGHYSGPSAGSVFKNNRAFGKPSGAIIDSLGLRGTRIGDAEISAEHANIFINRGNATSADIHKLIKLCTAKVKDAYGFDLEPEIQFIGNFQ